MGADGLVWMRWGVGNIGGHKTKSRRVKNGRAGYIFGPMAGEISPNIMFCDFRQKVVRMGDDG